MNNILVTGGAGYIGSHIIELLTRKSKNIVILDNLSTGYKKLINKKSKFIKGDVTNLNLLKKVIKQENIISVIHLAACLNVREAEFKPKKYYKNNVLGTLNLVKACKNSRVKNIIFSSSCSVYGSVNGSVSEKKKPNPQSKYALTKFDLDNLFFVPSRKAVNKAAAKSIDVIGDVCWHCHIGSGAFTINTAVKWNLKLMIWGESIAEEDGRGSYYDDNEHSPLYNVEVSALVRAEDYDDNIIAKSELSQWYYPSNSKMKSSGIRYLHLGDYIFWDAEYFTEFIIKHYGWKESYVEGTYKKYKSVECKMPGVHDYTKFLKRGFGRGTDFASQDVRAGIITREEGVDLAKEFDFDEPEVLKYYLERTGYTKEEFYQIVFSKREGNAKKLPLKEFFFNQKRSKKNEK